MSSKNQPTARIYIPRKDSMAHMVAMYLYQHGSKTLTDILAAFPQNGTMQKLKDSIAGAVHWGWLNLDGRDLSITRRASNYYAGTEVDTPSVSLVPSRDHGNVFQAKPLSSKYFLNPNGNRPDIPEWSQRDAHFHSCGTVAAVKIHGAEIGATK